jgi:integrase
MRPALVVSMGERRPTARGTTPRRLRTRWLKAPKPEFDFFTFEEAERLLDAADGEWQTAILVALRTGMRHGEILALRWEDVDLVAGRINVRQNVVWGGSRDDHDDDALRASRTGNRARSCRPAGWFERPWQNGGKNRGKLS